MEKDTLRLQLLDWLDDYGLPVLVTAAQAAALPPADGQSQRPALARVRPPPSPTRPRPDRRLTALRARFEDDGVTDDFRAGILFAIRLLADTEFDY